MSSGRLSQELVDLIVDDVHRIHGRPALLLLLRAARCFGPRCRKYIYEIITLPVKVDSGLLDESLKKRNLRLLETLQNPLTDIAWLVKRVKYDLCFDSHEILCMVATSAWDMLARLKPLLVNVEDVTVDFRSYEYLHGIYTSSAIHFDTPLAQAITNILPISAFTRLEISSLKLHPLPFIEMIAKFPHVSTISPWISEG
ncbi:hypothetical protein CPB85DRAFT_756024 [Mucidula mucida]|nr:hypothetical protein CPB85DRAFT_756024 [Mucidula mucida]